MFKLNIYWLNFYSFILSDVKYGAALLKFANLGNEYHLYI